MFELLENDCVFPESGPCLIRSSPELSAETNLRVPVLPKKILTLAFENQIFSYDDSSVNWQNNCHIPGSIGSICKVSVVYVGDRTCKNPQNIRKIKREIQIKFDENDLKSQELLNKSDAGDALYFLQSNPPNEVDIILNRLEEANIVDNFLTFTLLNNNFNFDYFPSPCSCRYLLTHCLDIRRSPGRPLIRALAQYCSDEKDERRLLELCSIQGTKEFTNFVRKVGLSLVDFLLAFPSCCPSISCLMELLPRLMPRAYSISNYHKNDEWLYRMRFVYSLLKTTPKLNGIYFSRYGVCTQWMNSLKVGDSIKVILKEAQTFLLPPPLMHNVNIKEIPLVFIGPGTGVALFISFLEKICAKGKRSSVKCYLFYGSSDLKEEFLFENELKNFKNNGFITDLMLCESRAISDPIQYPKYVFDALKKNGLEIAKLLTQKNALFYSCGDIKYMSTALWKCLCEICVEFLGYNQEEALKFLETMRSSQRLIEDAWS